MIPVRTSRPFGRFSPQPSEIDLAQLINRTVRWAVDNKRELGFAAVNVGCDGKTRTTMFDGSSCQVSGEVCIAERQDGISACIQAPTQGNGLTFQSVAFKAPVCIPVTGWWIVDALGFMYRVPQSLIDATPGWPANEAMGVGVTLMRAGTWAKLMCGAALAIPLNGEGGAVWYRSVESDWGQAFSVILGGTLPRWSVLPAATVTVGLTNVDVTFTAGNLALPPTGVLSLNGTSFFYHGAWLSAGTEYAVTYYMLNGLLESVEGPDVPLGTATEAAIPEGAWRIGYTVIPYGLTGAAFTATATLDDVRYPAWINPAANEAAPSVLLRDQVAPNAGLRAVSITLPAGDGVVVTGLVRVGYGYPFGSVAESGFHRHPSGDAPWMRSYTWEPPGTIETDTAGRVVGDMALAYRRGLAVEYADGHLNLDGTDIIPGDFVSLNELDYAHGPALDVAVNVIATPGQEIILSGGNGDLRSGKRYRVRSAPAVALAAVYEHQASSWGVEPNVWIDEECYYEVSPWTTPTDSFVISGEDFGDTATHPANGVAVVLWKRDDFETLYADSSFIQRGFLAETVGGITRLKDIYGGYINLPPWPGGSVYLAVVGRRVRFRYGWTYGVMHGAAIHESALSPLVSLEPSSGDIGSDTYSVAVTVPGGPAATVVRYVYRFAWDYGSVFTGGPFHSVGPWSYHGIEGGGDGGVYDRTCRRVKTLYAGPSEPGSDPITFFDEDTSLSVYGTRPPSPLIYVGPITVESPRPVHLLQPVNL